MRAILWAEICQLRRQPGMYLLMTLLTLLFAIAFGQSTVSEIVIPVFSEELQVDQGEQCGEAAEPKGGENSFSMG